MIRLRRCHLSCVGSRSARFSPVGLNFMAGEKAGNSVVFLENGGGKTTLAAFIYLTLWPDQNQFLLKKATKDSQTRVSGYLIPGQSAYCILECETRVDGSHEPAIRIIGQALQRRDSSERSAVDRHFFTFIPSAGLGFEDVPVQGLGGRTQSFSFDNFRGWLREQRAKFPAAELWDGNSVDEFVKKLRESHVEPDLVRVQVELNKREGGIDEHFKEHCADSRKFVHTLLDLALQSGKGDETASVLGKFLEEWQNVGHLEDETDFCERFAAALARLTDAQEKWAVADQEHKSCCQLAAGLWRALDRKASGYSAECAQQQLILNNAKEQASDAKVEVTNAYHHVTSYELQWLEMSFDEATQAAVVAEGQWNEAKRVDRFARLAILFGDIQRKRSELDAKRRVLQDKQDELAPLLAELNRLGAALASRLNEEIGNGEQGVLTCSATLKAERDREEQIERDRRNLAAERGKYADNLAEIKRFFERRRYQRDQLGQRSWLEANERAVDGRSRWSADCAEAEAMLQEQRSLTQAFDEKISEINRELVNLEGGIAKAGSDAAQLHSRLEEAREHNRAIVNHDLMIAHFGDAFDPLRHGAEEDVSRKQGDVFRILLGLQLDFAILERNRAGIATHLVLPPSRDVELVLRRLSQAGIDAYSGLTYLAETCSCDEAQQLIAHDPARFAGVLVPQDRWGQVVLIDWPEVTQPVEISPIPDSLATDEATKWHVVVPMRAAFDKTEAGRRARALDEEVGTLDRHIQARRAEYDGLGRALTLLRSFIERYGDGRLVAIERDLQSKQRHSEALLGRRTERRQELDRVYSDRQAARSQELATLERLEKRIRPALVALEKFISDFEDLVDQKRSEEEFASKWLLELDGEDEKLVAAHRSARRAAELTQSQMFRFQEALRKFREEASRIHYRQEIADKEMLQRSLESLRAGYDQGRQLYEGQQDVEAQLELRTAEKVLQEKESDFFKQLGDVSIEQVRSIAQQFGFAEERLREYGISANQQLEESVHERAVKVVARDAAKQKYLDKEREAPEGGKRRFPEGAARPTSSDEAYAALEEARAVHAERQQRKQEADEEVRKTADQVAYLSKLVSDYEAQRNLLDSFKGDQPMEVELPQEFGELKASVVRAQNDTKAAVIDENRKRHQRNDELKAAKAITTDIRYTEKNVGLAKRFELYGDEPLLRDLEQIRADLEQRIASNRDRLAGLKQTREQLVDMMDGLADEILLLLRSIEKVSRLPEEGMGAWSEKPFIRIAYHQPDESERQVGLRALLEGLVEGRRGKNGSTPDMDASGLIRMIADRLICDKKVRVQILKPTPLRTDSYEDVELLRHYSGGEGMTVAILMYLAIVQLRAQNVRNSHRLQDAGFLLLDNPFGKCNREDLVQMQVQLAEQLRVQLIVLTALGEPVIMMSYPRRIRLMNDLINRVTGAIHVRVVESEGTISAVENLRRFTFAV